MATSSTHNSNRPNRLKIVLRLPPSALVHQNDLIPTSKNTAGATSSANGSHQSSSTAIALSDRVARYEARVARASQQPQSIAGVSPARPLEAAENGVSMRIGASVVAVTMSNDAVEEVQYNDMTSDVLEGASNLLKLAMGQEEGGQAFARGLEERIAQERG